VPRAAPNCMDALARRQHHAPVRVTSAQRHPPATGYPALMRRWGLSMRRLVALVLAVTLAACAVTAVTEPVVVIGKNGQTLRGTATGRMNGDGSFSVTDGQLTCGGNYNSLSMETTINAQVLCSDGRKGIVISTRESSGLAGHGTVKLNDGSQWTFIFGSAAANF